MVLCHPTESGNVGRAIRAVANFELAGVRIVREQPFDPEELRKYSSGSIDFVEVTYFATLAEAVADCRLVVGSTRRPREPDAPPQWPAAGLAKRVAAASDTALVFGHERAGMSRTEIDQCDAVVLLHSGETYPSMNLGAAVACLAYELRRPADETVGPRIGVDVSAGGFEPRSSAKQRDAFYIKMHDVVEELGYPPGRNPILFVRRMKRLLSRADPSDIEFGLVAGVFSELLRLGRMSAKR